MSRIYMPPFGAGMGRDRAAGAGFRPTDAGLWLPADRNPAGLVSSFPDASGTMSPFTSAGGARPTSTATGSPNSLNVLAFAGGQNMSVAAAATGQYNYTLFALVQSPVAVSEQLWYSLGSNGVNDGTALGTANNTQRIVHQIGAGVMHDGIPSSGWEIWSLTCDTSHVYTLRVNGIAASFDVNNSGSFPPTVLTAIGAYGSGGGLFWTGNMAELFVYPGQVLGASAIVARENYLATKWSQNLPQLIFEGNSLIAGVGSSSNATNYPSQVGSLLGGRYTIYNNGISGEQTPTMTSNSARISGSLKSALRPKNICIGWECTNDSRFNDSSAATLLANYWAWAATVVAWGGTPVAMTYMSRSDAGTPGDFNTNRATVNAGIRSGYIANGCAALIDVAADSILGIDGAELNLTYFGGDKVHLNDAGYARVAGIAAPILAGL